MELCATVGDKIRAEIFTDTILCILRAGLGHCYTYRNLRQAWPPVLATVV